MEHCLVIWAILAIKLVLGSTPDISKETLNHVPHHPIKEPHFDEEGGHNTEFDHDAVIGSHDLHDQFDEMGSEELKKRFGNLIDKMDKNNDGFVTKEELSAWVHASFRNLNKEEALDKMGKHDVDHDNKVTISEYLQKVYGYSMEEIYDFHKDKNPDVQEMAKMMFGDVEKFKKADLNADGLLDKSEYPAFIHPYDYDFMHNVELNLMLKQYDKNEDNFIDFSEYLTQPGQVEPDSKDEQLIVDKENFDLYDTDDNGKLDVSEIHSWAIPDYDNAAEDEADHLISLTDDDDDGRLSRDEILAQQDLWVGSSATHYGDKLHDPSEL